jgi:hypothetical protein
MSLKNKADFLMHGVVLQIRVFRGPASMFHVKHSDPPPAERPMFHVKPFSPAPHWCDVSRETPLREIALGIEAARELTMAAKSASLRVVWVRSRCRNIQGLHHRRRHQRAVDGKALKDKGVPFDCFEMSDQVGGNWASRTRTAAPRLPLAPHRHSKERLQLDDFRSA